MKTLCIEYNTLHPVYTNFMLILFYAFLFIIQYIHICRYMFVLSSRIFLHFNIYRILILSSLHRYIYDKLVRDNIQSTTVIQYLKLLNTYIEAELVSAGSAQKKPFFRVRCLIFYFASNVAKSVLSHIHHNLYTYTHI